MPPFQLHNINSVRDIARQVLRYKKSGTVLDLGCGIGRHALYFAKKGFRVTAVDNKSDGLAALRELARLQKLRIAIYRADAAGFDAGRMFDVVISAMVLHFMPAHAQTLAIANMQKQTKPGGLNVLCVYTDKNPKGLKPHLPRAGAIRQAYEKAGWEILIHREGLGAPMPNAHGTGTVRFYIEELLARRP
jgi:tellurite methyltransferase